ncbi:RecQ family ATP-dependent DNA helicase [Aggregatimonas sangjinii]|uniref:ATP-dependent DNA helicase RecQ n=1 Tax=Aggregatimonas sangjinii TaxID=2583587 RepID=A0A5B7SNJ4_9FLAO|nr:RecQ family ATP-dependent DNA helicase [Aggregatimonas sangjinii]QCW99711.1 RecQ family ATP-dependent DNA helicase [Aggregatimonas sangjinii]
MHTPKHILNTYWGHSEFRGSQEEVITAILENKDVLALMPTGGGKSVCFQVPALVMEGICIVVSPLVALIQNQVNSLRNKGIKAIALTGGIPQNEIIDLLDNCCFGNYKFLYLSPERLKQELVQERIQQMPVNLIAIDEAHCISQWGHDFRPAYLECAKLRKLAPESPIIALTATATQTVADDIIESLLFSEPLVVKDSFARKNIAFGVLWADDKKYRLRSWCAKIQNSAIVYVSTRRAAQELCSYLVGQGISTTFFHGGISKEDKQKRLDLWLRNTVKVMVATNAFGMGIDKPDVELIVHYQIPDCIENYFQEAGRAGRNGASAKAILLTNKTDEQQVKNQFLSVLPDTAFIKMVYNKLNNYFQISYGELPETEFLLNFNAFCETYKLNTLLAFNAFRILDQYSVISLNESFFKKTIVQVLVGKQQLFEYLEKNQGLVPIVQTILRTYGGVFDFLTKINPFLIAKKAETNEARVTRVLEQLQKDAIIDYDAQESDLSLVFLVPREDDITINSFAKKVQERHRLKETQIDSMLAYVKNDQQCRNKQLLHYFEEEVRINCGICDVCRRISVKAETNSEAIMNDIIKLLNFKNSGSRSLIASLNYEENLVLEGIKMLLEDRRIKINSRNEYEIV